MDVSERRAALDHLHAEVRACERCDLCKTRTQAVPGEGPATAQIMLVGEGPGQREDQLGRPFVGASGQWLTELLGLAGLKREDVYITNVVKSRPPGNRDPLPDEIEACRTWLEQQLAIIQPKVIITLGRYSMAWFCGAGLKISQVHGRARRCGDRVVMTMYHPAAGLRSPDVKRQIEEDFAKIPRLLAALEKEEAPPTAKDDTGTDETPPTQLSLF
ncbi:MAG: uracil-DNA glycosylase [Anaerolineae bacterium]